MALRVRFLDGIIFFNVTKNHNTHVLHVVSHYMMADLKTQICCEKRKGKRIKYHLLKQLKRN